PGVRSAGHRRRRHRQGVGQRARQVAYVAAALVVSIAGSSVPLGNATATAEGSSGIEFYLSAPKVQGSFVLDGSVETFDTASGSITDLAIGTVVAGTLSVASTNVYGGAVSSSPDPLLTTGGTGTKYGFPTSSATIELDGPMRYVGFWWPGGDESNVLIMRREGAEIARFTTADIVSLLGGLRFDDTTGNMVTAIDGVTQYDAGDYIHNPRLDPIYSPNPPYGTNWPYAFVSVIAEQQFDEIEVQSINFEFDNLTVAPYSVTPPGSLVKVPQSIAVVGDEVAVTTGVTVDGDASTNDTVPEGSILSVISEPAEGTLTMQEDGTYTYVPGSNPGTFSAVYQLCPAGVNDPSTCPQRTLTFTVSEPAPPTTEAPPATSTPVTSTPVTSTPATSDPATSDPDVTGVLPATGGGLGPVFAVLVLTAGAAALAVSRWRRPTAG
ncbi:MAG: hypothetical protein RLZZ01_514, partial [Actinomycetota bacterium]